MLYTSLYQGVRIAGLLHDIGHLPYSHTLEEILEILKGKWKKEHDKSPDKEKYLKLINTYKKGKFSKLHEAISMKLFPTVEAECVRLVTPELNKLVEKKEFTEDEKNNYLALCLFSFEIAKRILFNVNSNSMINNILHKIISGTLDADRLDYASRDLFCSGVSTDVINYRRMFTFLSFEKNLDGKSKNRYPLTIPPKTVGDVEEYLRKRWKIYRDINFHHSVHKNELLMRNILINFAENSRQILSQKNGSTTENLDLPNDFLQGILCVLNELHESANASRIADIFLRLDDSWLDTLIKKNENRRLTMVDELIYGGKNYQTIIKRFGDFLEFADKKTYDLFNCYAPQILEFEDKFDEAFERGNFGEEKKRKNVSMKYSTI